MRIWIDLSNSPHVLFFAPIISLLEEQGHEVKVTARDFAQTIQLANKYGLNFETMGRHGGKSIYGKSKALINHSLILMKWAKKTGIDLAVSHNSYSQSIAASLARIPSVTIMDYEYQPANHLSFRLAKRVIVPEVFPQESLRLYGARKNKVRKYVGLKEEVYLFSFVPDPSYLDNIGIKNDRIIATVRPPADFALYHRFENPLFEELIDWLTNKDEVLTIFIPRTNEQKELFTNRNYRNTFIPQQVLDGPNLLYYSDMVISAGGTMNREAAVLGSPVYTIFAGRISAVDDYLIKTGQMIRLQEKCDFNKIKLCKRNYSDFQGSMQSSIDRIVEFILDR